MIVSIAKMKNGKNYSRLGTLAKSKSLLSCRKGLSPIFATLIILAVVTALFIPVFLWATNVSSGTEESWRISGTIATERIIVEEVNLKKDAPSCTIYVRNIGKTTVTISNVLISRADGTSAVDAYQGNELQIDKNSVVQGELITVKITALKSQVEIATYDIKVATTRGVSGEYQAVVTNTQP
jgi:flagellin-like protein